MQDHHEYFAATLFNKLIANPLASLLGYEPANGVLPPHLVMVILVCLGLTAFSLWLRRHLSVDNPRNIQQALEVIFGAILSLMQGVIGPDSRRFFPLMGALFLFILACNLLGLVPGFMSPTENLNVTAGCALLVFFYYNYQGIRAHGFLKYMAHFAGPSLFIAPLLFVIEIISHLARPFSLSVRLFGNIYAEEMIIGILNGIFPFLVAIPVMALAMFASTVQAFIFMVLTMVYVGGAVEHPHGEHPPEHSPGDEHPIPAGERGALAGQH